MRGFINKEVDWCTVTSLTLTSLIFKRNKRVCKEKGEGDWPGPLNRMRRVKNSSMSSCDFTPRKMWVNVMKMISPEWCTGST